MSPGLGHSEVNVVMRGKEAACSLEGMELTAESRMAVREEGEKELLPVGPRCGIGPLGEEEKEEREDGPRCGPKGGEEV